MKRYLLVTAMAILVAVIWGVRPAQAGFDLPESVNGVAVKLPTDSAPQAELWIKLDGSGTNSACESKLASIQVRVQCNAYRWEEEGQISWGDLFDGELVSVGSFAKTGLCVGKVNVGISSEHQIHWGDVLESGHPGGECLIDQPQTITLKVSDAEEGFNPSLIPSFEDGDNNGMHDGFEEQVPEPDADGDGVQDSSDQCEDTPLGAQVNSAGCPDSDHDGIYDNVDQCKDTPLNTEVKADGCPLHPSYKYTKPTMTDQTPVLIPREPVKKPHKPSPAVKNTKVYLLEDDE